MIKAKTVFLEQASGIRAAGNIGGIRSFGLRHEVPRVLKAILIRRDLINHMTATFPKMESYWKPYTSFQYYKMKFDVDEDGSRAPTRGHEEEDDDTQELPGSGVETSCSTYACLGPLISFLERLMRNQMEALVP